MSSQPSMSLAQSELEFSSNMFRSITSASKNQNVIFSPFSIFMALSMASVGAAELTLSEMLKGLSVKCNTQQFEEWKEVEMKPFMSNVMKKIVLDNTKELSLANRLFVSKRSELQERFQTFTKEAFDTQVQLCNFEEDPQGEANNINLWVESVTNNLVKNLIKELTVDTKVVIVNAIYFLGNWKEQFSKELTLENQPFYQMNNVTSKANMMNKRKVKTQYGSDDLYKWVTLPYSNQEFSMTFFLPHDQTTITEDSESNFNEWLVGKLNKGANFPTQKEELTLLAIPKFNAEFDIELKDILKQEPFSMESAFSDRANFSQLSKTDDLKIGNVIHKAVIKVTEEGTEAAAATAIVFKNKKKCVGKKTETKDFIANRPFSFIITHNSTSMVLFAGKINSTQ